MKAFTIPVAFLVEGIDEDDAAHRLAGRILRDIGNGDRGPAPGAIESWWLPNHPPFTHGGDLDMPRLRWTNESVTTFVIDSIMNKNHQNNLTQEQIDDFKEGLHQSSWDTLMMWTEALEEDLYEADLLSNINHREEDDENE